MNITHGFTVQLYFGCNIGNNLSRPNFSRKGLFHVHLKLQRGHTYVAIYVVPNRQCRLFHVLDIHVFFFLFFFFSICRVIAMYVVPFAFKRIIMGCGGRCYLGVVKHT